MKTAFAVLIGGLALFVIGAGLWILFMPQEQPVDRPVIGDFVTKSGVTSKNPNTKEPGRCRYLEIQYWGVDTLQNVKIECSFLYVDRTSGTQPETFDRWNPGETKYVVFAVGPSVQYRWKGEAQMNGQPVVLSGATGDQQ